LKSTFENLPLAKILKWTTLSIQGVHMPIAYRVGNEDNLLGVFCFVKHGSYPK